MVPEPVQGRQKSTIVLKSLDLQPVLARLSVPTTQTTAETIEDLRFHYAVPDWEQHPGVKSGEYRTRVKHKVGGLSRSQYELYLFSTKHNLSEAEVDELLEMLGNEGPSLMHT